MKKTKNKGQEEMVGFALIIIIVSIILLIFLSISLSNRQQKEAVESYEAENFILASLEYTTECNNGLEYLPIRRLIFACYDEETCRNGENTCEVLNSTFKDILSESWKIGDETPVKGYEMSILSDNSGMLLIQEGNKTQNFKGTIQSFARRGVNYEIIFNAYY